MSAPRDPYGTTAMFEPEPTPVAAPYADVSSGYGRITYARYRVKRPVKCDDCMGAYVNNPSAPHSRVATYKRTQAGANTLLLCHEHTRIRRESEGLT